MVEFKISDASYDSRSHWSWDIDRKDVPPANMVCPCELDGFTLSKLEVEYSWINSARAYSDFSQCGRMLRKDWMKQIGQGNIYLNHAWIFERKAYDGAARKQIESWAQVNPIIGKLLLLRPKWGFSLSVDYADISGNVYELYAISCSGNDFNGIEISKLNIERLVSSVDWDKTAETILANKSQWEALPPEQQRHRKTGLLVRF
jgi:hypothetical protein